MKVGMDKYAGGDSSLPSIFVLPILLSFLSFFMGVMDCKEVVLNSHLLGIFKAHFLLHVRFPLKWAMYCNYELFKCSLDT